MTTSGPLAEAHHSGPAGADDLEIADPSLRARFETLRRSYRDEGEVGLDWVVARLTGGRPVRDGEAAALLALLAPVPARPVLREDASRRMARFEPNRFARFLVEVEAGSTRQAALSAPTSVVLATVRPAAHEGVPPDARREMRISRMCDRLAAGFSLLAVTHRLDAVTLGLVLPALTLRQAIRLAEGTRRAFETVHRPSVPASEALAFAAGVATALAGEDPRCAVLRAADGLACAVAGEGSRVVCETDPEIDPEGRRPVGQPDAAVRLPLIETKPEPLASDRAAAEQI